MPTYSCMFILLNQRLIGYNSSVKCTARWLVNSWSSWEGNMYFKMTNCLRFNLLVAALLTAQRRATLHINASRYQTYGDDDARSKHFEMFFCFMFIRDIVIITVKSPCLMLMRNFWHDRCFLFTKQAQFLMLKMICCRYHTGSTDLPESH